MNGEVGFGPTHLRDHSPEKKKVLSPALRGSSLTLLAPQGAEKVVETVAPGAEKVVETVAPGAEKVTKTVAPGAEKVAKTVAPGAEKVAESTEKQDISRPTPTKSAADWLLIFFRLESVAPVRRAGFSERKSGRESGCDGVSYSSVWFFEAN
ncbi:hypothetical protein RD149_14490 [Gordonia westfalica]|uniref:Uncharacterized protein n=1 Tax=Gordonia westfalica TaxID=158898 RepID=A0ABU2GVN8_9ACTN|nr:hypothetical protein [Gordonia westfalica]MDS1114975.1 hypothetical protein [Gordonia westfalica]